jgi:hypothetical protein
VRIEQVMDHARRAVQGNSTTARQLYELGMAGGTDYLSNGGNFSMNPADHLNAALVYGALRGRRAIDQRVSRQVAEMLASPDINRFHNGMRLLSQHNTLFGALRNADVTLAGIVARGALPALTH